MDSLNNPWAVGYGGGGGRGGPYHLVLGLEIIRAKEYSFLECQIEEEEGFWTLDWLVCTSKLCSKANQVVHCLWELAKLGKSASASW